MVPELRPVLTDAVIRRSVEGDAFGRGRAYALEGRVHGIEYVPALAELTAFVTGSQRRVYRTVASYDGDSARWWGECSCPVQADCKHVAALLTAARGGSVAAPVAPRPPQWEDALADLVETHGPAGAATPIALQFDVEAARYPQTRRSVRLRPVVPGAKGRWVRSRMSWRTLPYDTTGRRNEAHVAALEALYRASHAGSGVPTSWYGGSEPPVLLEEFGPGLWPGLRQAVDDGVALLTTRGGPVRVTGPGELVVDVRAEDGGGLRMQAVVELDDGLRVPVDSVLPIGSPPHGAAILSAADGGPPEGVPADLVAGEGMALVPLQRVPRSVERLVARGSVRVPAGDRTRFLGTFYPALRRALPVRSSDGSVELPEIAPPRLCLSVAHQGGHRVRLTWSVLYRAGEEARRVPLAFGTGVVPDAGRDVAAEGRLLDALPAPPERLLRLWHVAPPRPIATAELSGMDTVVLVTEFLPRLADAGVEVEVSGQAPDFRQARSAPVVALSAVDRDGSDWFDLGVTVSVAGEDIPFAQLFAALAAGEEFLLLPSGTWFDVRRPEFERLRALIDEARALQDADRPQLRISRYQAGLWEELVQLGVVEEQSERWARDVRTLLEVDVLPLPAAPAGLTAQLRPYQLEGYQWLSALWAVGLGGVLADDMGLGKTLQTLALVCRAAEAGELTAPVLVVAPTSVVSNWAREAQRFAPGLRVRTVEGTARRRGAPLADAAEGADLVITSYTLLRLGEEEYRALPWSGLVLDEAQFVKNHQAKTYAAARRLPARVKLAITGTPVENSLMDLWSMLSIVAPGLFPSPQRFTEHYRHPIERGRDPERLDALRRRIRPLVRRRTKEQVAAELPAKQEQVLEVVLGPRHRKVYDTHLQRERRKVLGLVDDLQAHRFTIFRSLTLLRQLALDPALVDDDYAGVGSSKADAFLEHLQEVVAEGHRALVFSSFTGFLGTVRARLDAAGLPYAYLDGSTRDRDAVISSFRDGAAPVFLISLKAGGFGLNLTEADYVYVLDPWWNPAAEAQAVDRTHRIGQDKTVMVYRLVAADTIEQKVLALQERKRDLFARVMDDEDDALAGPLTAEDIRGLFS